MYLSTPDAHCLGPIKLQLPEPQANLKEALQVLKLHHSKLNTTKVSLQQRRLPSLLDQCVLTPARGSGGPAGLGSATAAAQSSWRWIPGA